MCNFILIRFLEQEQGRTGPSGLSRECLGGRLHEVEKSLYSEYGGLCSVYMKELTLNTVDLSEGCNPLSLSLPTDLHFTFLKCMSRLSQTVPGQENLVSPPRGWSMRMAPYVQNDIHENPAAYQRQYFYQRERLTLSIYIRNSYYLEYCFSQ